MVDAGGDVLRPLHGDARQHRREHRPPRDQVRLRSVHLRPLVGGQRLHPELRCPARHRRPARRRLRPQAHVPGGPRRVHARVHRRGALAVDRAADLLACRPGRRGRVPDAGLALDPDRRLPRPRARARARPVGRHLRPGARHGPGARRPARREGRLGVDLLPERPGRGDRRARDPLRRARVARPVRGAPDRLGGHRHAVARDGPRRAGPRSGQRRGLDIDPHARRAGGRRGRPRGLRLAPDRRRRPHGRPRLLQEPHVLGREPGRVPRDLLDVRDVLLHHALHAGHPAPLAARDRRAVPADDGADHRDGPHRRAPVRPLRQPLAPGRGHAARVALAGARVAHHRHERLPHPPPRVHRGRDRDGDDDVADDRGRDGLR